MAYELDDEDFPDPDYGVFGDNAQPFDVNDWMRRFDAFKREAKEIERARRQREHSRKVSREFNLHMIDLFNRK